MDRTGPDDGGGDGLQQRLGFRPPTSRAWRRALLAVVASRWGSRVAARVLPPLDRLVRRASGERATLTGVVAGLPTGFLTTTGARTGLPRTAPLLLIPCGPDLAVIGSNWGGVRAPGWVHNLHADPRGTLELGGRTVAVRALLVEGPERDAVWRSARAMYAGYAGYEARAAHRYITVWRLVADG